MKIEISQAKLEQILHEIRSAHLEGFRSCQFTESREEDLFNCSSAAKSIDQLRKEFELLTKNIK